MKIQEKRPKCQTKGCENIALGCLSGKFRCGKCIKKFEQYLKNKMEEIFIEECS